MSGVSLQFVLMHFFLECYPQSIADTDYCNRVFSFFIYLLN